MEFQENFSKSTRKETGKTYLCAVCQLIGEFVIIIVQTSSYFQNTNNKEDFFFCFHIVLNAQANVISFQLNFRAVRNVV